MQLIEKIDTRSTQPEISTPDPARVIDGNPVHSTWNLEDRDGLFCGVWQSTPGAWMVSYDEWEYFTIRSGHSILTDAVGTVTDLRAGDAFVLRPGFSGLWRVVETTLKEYVIVMPR